MTAFTTPYEALGDRRFQLFVQSLLTYDFPDLQAFPVGQRDGGRDAVVRFGRGPKFIAFQVKFVERPDYLDDVPQWITGIIRKERENISSLAERGATKYILITNVPASSHPDSGGIDRGERTLADLNLPIPAQIWWRNDLDTRLAKHSALKWGYRELLTGQDVLDGLLSSGLMEHKNRRRDAIVAALRTQYEADRLVRFQQVELQNDLLDLFVDVYLEDTGTSPVRRPFDERGKLAWAFNADQLVLIRTSPNEGPSGAAHLLLTQPPTPRTVRIVIEGAPGQGKSTLAQYVCQVHRMIVLDKTDDIDRLPESYCGILARLPFKVDARDLATFFRGDDPFEQVKGWGSLPDNWPRSLVGYLAAQVWRYSGGAEFSVSDLLAVTGTGPVLLVIDGLDEVAEVADRRAVVENVTEGLGALDEVAQGLQVVVTTRPRAYANSPGFPSRAFQYCKLGSLKTDQIFDYTHRWAAARRLNDVDLSSVLSVLDTKLSQPHMRDLARNAMQLAILLSLIYTRGESLPDKRTHLYHSYMDMYFNREVEKSAIVRRHRDVLFGLHGYLAWRLHAGAEQSAEGGSIGLAELEDVVARYLADQGEDPAVAEELFRGVVERIIALVATRQERFEFEVQPIREFFAAYHLFTTAQVAQFGVERPGTRADRFDAVVRNSFWLNTARFFAGFYNSGELSSLADSIEALVEDEALFRTEYVRTVASMLLSDWTFSLSRRSRERVIAVVLRGFGERHVLNGAEGVDSLPDGNGRCEVREATLSLLENSSVLGDRREALFDVLGEHIDQSEFADEWLERTQRYSGRPRTEWLRFGARCRLLAQLDAADIVDAALGDHDESELAARAMMLVDQGSVEVVESSEALARAAVQAATRAAGWTRYNPGKSLLLALNELLAAGARQRTSDGTRVIARAVSEGELGPGPDYLADVRTILSLAPSVVDRFEAVEAWSDVVQAVEATEPGGWATVAICASVIQGLYRRHTKGNLALLDQEQPIMMRAQSARAHAGEGADGWWRSQCGGLTAVDRTTRLVTLTAMILWTAGDALRAVLEPMTVMIESLSENDLEALDTVVKRAAQLAPAKQIALSMEEMENLSPRLGFLLLPRVPPRERALIWRTCLDNAQVVAPDLLGRALIERSLAVAKTEDEWQEVVSLVRRVDPTGEAAFLWGAGIAAPVAAAVVDHAADYPLWLVRSAESELAEWLPPPRALIATSERERWFLDAS